MHIGFDISQTGKDKAGCGYFAHALIKGLLEAAPEYKFSLFPHFGDFYFNPLMPVFNPYPGEKVSYGPRFITRDNLYDFWNSSELEIKIGNPNIIHANNFSCPQGFKVSRLIYTLYDMSFLLYPHWTTEDNRLGCFKGVFSAACNADWIVAISEYSKKHFLETFPHFPAERIKIIYPCSRFYDLNKEVRQPKKLKNIVPGNFWLSVGTIEPRKNHYTLIKAYAQYFSKSKDPLPLVLAGGKGWLMNDFYNCIAEKGLSDYVIITDYISDDELIWLYKNCTAHFYPSFFEGFGLPVLEGMQFGAPTVASSITSIPEITGKAAILLNPENVNQWTDAMVYLASDKNACKDLSNAAKMQTVKFSWKSSVDQLLSLYTQAWAEPKRINI